ncbi:MAG: hypothetical protein V4473_02085 [Patescibacteria group bacterium]
MAQKNNDMSSKVAVGVGIGMLAAISAGAYFLYGTKEGAKKRVKIRGWVLKAKGEVLEKMENLKEVNEETYNTLVHSVMKKYEGLKNVDKAEVDALVTDLKKHWKSIKRHIDESSKPKKIAKKTAKKKIVNK